ncbi:unnamed protein product [Lymnaea stagnalis]|uniref:EF-hand domain-containing protein n=1 Tax=Lymnaea stagnalis TaxID=6523 RepID=A0AAV2IFH9_LYMST
MHLFLIFLISVLPLTLAQLTELRSLTYYRWADRAFKLSDTNNDTLLDSDECTASFYRLKDNDSVEDITLHALIARYGAYRLSASVSTSLFNQYDKDGSGLVDIWDFLVMYVSYDTDKDFTVTREEFIRANDEIFTIAGAPRFLGK